MKTVCIYHSVDLDGWMSAAIVKYWFINNNKHYYILNENGSIDKTAPGISDNLLHFIGYNYGQPIPDLSEYDKVIMCDISFEPTVMKGLIDRFINNFIWIDHHISAIESCPQTLPYANSIDDLQPVSGIRDTKFAACELTWKYFFPNEPVPEIVRLLGLYDSFRHKNTDEEQKVLEFQYGARSCISNYEEAYTWLTTDKYINYNGGEDSVVEHIHKKGVAIYQYLCTDAKQSYKNGFEVDFFEPQTTISDNGSCDSILHKFICINKERFNPINFGIDYHKDGYDGVASFHYDGSAKLWRYSLYNDNGKVDCSAIAKQFGGGGHKGAAGFTSKIII